MKPRVLLFGEFCLSIVLVSSELFRRTCDPITVTSCDTILTYLPAPGENPGNLYVRGEFNGWSLETPMARAADGSFRATVQLEAGDYGYKLFDQTGERAFASTRDRERRWSQTWTVFPADIGKAPELFDERS